MMRFIPALLTADAYREILEEFSSRLDMLQKMDQILGLRLLQPLSCRVECQFVEVDFLPLLQDALKRSEEVDQAIVLVTAGPVMMDETSVFEGTKVPVSIVLGSLDISISSDRIKVSYPFLTEAHI